MRSTTVVLHLSSVASVLVFPPSQPLFLGGILLAILSPPCPAVVFCAFLPSVPSALGVLPVLCGGSPVTCTSRFRLFLDPLCDSLLPFLRTSPAPLPDFSTFFDSPALPPAVLQPHVRPFPVHSGGTMMAFSRPTLCSHSGRLFAGRCAAILGLSGAGLIPPFIALLSASPSAPSSTLSFTSRSFGLCSASYPLPLYALVLYYVPF